MGKVFEVFEGPIRRAITVCFDEILQPGLNPTLNEDDEQHIIDKILTDKQQGNSMRPKEVFAYTNEQYKLHLTKGWLQTFLIRNSENIERADSYPVDSKRFNVPRIYFTNYFDTMKVHIIGKVAELVFNLDEVGISPWADKKVKHVIIGKKEEKDKIYHKVNRNTKM